MMLVSAFAGHAHIIALISTQFKNSIVFSVMAMQC